MASLAPAQQQTGRAGLEESVSGPVSGTVELVDESGKTEEETTMEAASAIASEAFSWERNRRDKLHAVQVREAIKLKRQKDAFEKEAGFKRLRSMESYSKDKARRKLAAQKSVDSRRKAAWEIAAKAFSEVNEEDMNNHA